MKRVFLIFLISFSLLVSYVFACTGFVVKSGDRVLIGINEDYFTAFTDSNLEIIPATSNSYGCFLVGFNRQNFSMAGGNDQGLFCDWFSVPRNNWQSKPEKETYTDGFKPCNILRRCATIEEAIAYLKRYNLNIFDGNRVMLADKTGRAAVVEWGKEDLEVIWKDKSYLVATNFLLNDPQKGGYPCPRYDTATRMLENETPSLDLCRRILDAAHAETSAVQTKYSNVYELQTGDVYLYNYFNYNEHIRLNIYEELKKGQYQNYLLPSYFSELKNLVPAQDATVDPSSVTFSCNGDESSEYALVYSKSVDFKDAVELRGNEHKQNVYAMSSSYLYLGGVLILGGFLRKKRSGLIALMLVCCVFIGCSTNNDNDDQKETEPFKFSKTVTNLDSNTIYYWKIVAKKKEGLVSESTVRTFKTS